MNNKNFKDRIIIFRQLLNNCQDEYEKDEVFQSLMYDYYVEFNNFCREVIMKADLIKDVNCKIKEDGSPIFKIIYK